MEKITKDKKNWFKIQFEKHPYLFTFLIGWPAIFLVNSIIDPKEGSVGVNIAIIIFLSFPLIIFFSWALFRKVSNKGVSKEMKNLKKKKKKLFIPTSIIILGIILILPIWYGASIFIFDNVKIIKKDTKYVIIRMPAENRFLSKEELGIKHGQNRKDAAKLAGPYCSSLGSGKIAFVLVGEQKNNTGIWFDTKEGSGGTFTQKWRFFCANDIDQALYLFYENIPENFNSYISRVTKYYLVTPYSMEIGSPALSVQRYLPERLVEKYKNAKIKEVAKKSGSEDIDREINPNLLTIGSGSGFYINNKGYALTNSHVVEICEQVITIVEGRKILFHIIANDEVIDIGLIKSTKKNSNYLRIETDGAKLGEDVIAVGYPLSGQLSDSVKITKGIVSSLSGIGNNSAQIQIDAALQPGNSGGPILNQSGDVIGIASASLNKLLMIVETATIPENVNFAVAAPSIVTFLKTKKIKYSTGSFFSKEYSTHELAEIGQESTIQLLCLNTRAAYSKLKKSKAYSDVLLDLN